MTELLLFRQFAVLGSAGSADAPCACIDDRFGQSAAQRRFVLML
jgi:hypothetical protein